uniref:(northern house mosquito) hypothetical protein n=1 Tax=Culex pipiens TaxID=7175 RepID=A0A8D8CHA9_CULPI
MASSWPTLHYLPVPLLELSTCSSSGTFFFLRTFWTQDGVASFFRQDGGFFTWSRRSLFSHFSRTCPLAAIQTTLRLCPGHYPALPVHQIRLVWTMSVFEFNLWTVFCTIPADLGNHLGGSDYRKQHRLKHSSFS